MRKELKLDVLIVFATWFVFLFGIGWWREKFPLALTFGALRGLALVWIVGGIAGVAVAFLLAETRLRVRQALAERDPDAEAEAVVIDGEEANDDKLETLVRLPQPNVVRLARSASGNPLHARDWWPDYARRFPVHAALVDQVYRLMQTRPDMPAGISLHAGETLVQHSLQVTMGALDASRGWTFDGVRNSTGAIVIPANDPKHNANLGDGNPLREPLLVLAAFAHDLGKVECLLTPAGGEPVMLPGHEERGVALLRRLPAFQRLPRADRVDLVLAARNYHHPTLIPMAPWVTDRGMSLACLLSVADRAHVAAEDQVDAPVAAPTAAAKPSEVADGAPAAAPHYQSAGGASVLDLFAEAVSGPGAINGQNVGTRIAWKYGAWLYVMLERLLARVGALADDPSLGAGGAVRHPFTLDLLAGLNAAGNLFLGSPPRRAERAIWTAVSSSRGEASTNQARYQVLVVKAAAVPGAAGIQDCAYAPLVTDKDGGGLDVANIGKNVIDVTIPRNASSISAGQAVSGSSNDGRQALTEGALLAYAALEPRQPGVAAAVDKQGHKLWIFDLPVIQRAFLVDTSKLPDGVELRTSTKTGQQGLTVRRR